MMTDTPSSPDVHTLVCGKCSAHNEESQHRCRACGAHLYVICKVCKERTPRRPTACRNCNVDHRGLAQAKASNLPQRLQGHVLQGLAYAAAIIALYLVWIWLF